MSAIEIREDDKYRRWVVHTDDDTVCACPECDDTQLWHRKTTGDYRCPNGHVFDEPLTRGRRTGGVIPTEDLIADLRAGYELLGRAPRVGDVNAFGEYSAQTYMSRFGSWADALRAADIPLPAYLD